MINKPPYIKLIKQILEKDGWTPEEPWDRPTKLASWWCAYHQRWTIVNSEYKRESKLIIIKGESDSVFRVAVENRHTTHSQFFIKHGAVIDP